jgi:fumarylacetoacetate (FAA) hydrolase
MLGCDFQLRSVREDASDAGTAFSPVALTPDELGPAWRGGRVQLELSCKLNGRSLGRLPAGSPMQHHFGQLIAALAAQRPVGAGTLVGSGAISSEDGERGTACLFERRALEAVHDGAPSTPWLAEGDRLRIEMLDAQGRSPFGAIDVVVRVAGARAPLAAA